MELDTTLKTLLPIEGPGEEAAMISADTLNNLQVNNLLLFEPIMKQYFANKVQSFKGGQLAHFLDKWKQLTSDSEVLNCVKGQFIEFSTQPTKNLGPKRKTFSISDSLVIEAEIQKLLDKGVIVPTQHESGEYVSPIFVANKKDGSYRMILNLKNFNQHVEYQHFKMDTVWTAIRLMTQIATWRQLILRTLTTQSLLQSHTKSTSNLNGTTCYLCLHVFPMGWLSVPENLLSL